MAEAIVNMTGYLPGDPNTQVTIPVALRSNGDGTYSLDQSVEPVLKEILKTLHQIRELAELSVTGLVITQPAIYNLPNT